MKNILKVFAVMLLVAALFGAFDSSSESDSVEFGVVTSVSADNSTGSGGGAGTTGTGGGDGDGTCPDGWPGCG